MLPASGPARPEAGGDGVGAVAAAWLVQQQRHPFRGWKTRPPSRIVISRTVEVETGQQYRGEDSPWWCSATIVLVHSGLRTNRVFGTLPAVRQRQPLADAARGGPVAAASSGTSARRAVCRGPPDCRATSRPPESPGVLPVQPAQPGRRRAEDKFDLPPFHHGGARRTAFQRR